MRFRFKDADGSIGAGAGEARFQAEGVNLATQACAEQTLARLAQEPMALDRMFDAPDAPPRI